MTIGTFPRNAPNGRKDIISNENLETSYLARRAMIASKGIKFLTQKSGVDELIILLSSSFQLFHRASLWP
jgi:hypothetical protein